jgi:hypothetical protein
MLQSVLENPAESLVVESSNHGLELISSQVDELTSSAKFAGEP